MAKENIVIEKSYAFALRIIKLYKYLADTHKEYVISKQVLRSGTAIGALLSELVYAQSKADFIIAIGGGSPLDASKAIAMYASNDIEPHDIFNGEQKNKPLHLHFQC